MLVRRTVVPLALALGVTIMAVVGVSATAFLSSGNRPHTNLFDVLGIPLFLIAVTTLPGAITYVLTRRDFRTWVAVVATAVCVVLVGAGAWIGFVFAFFAYFAAPAAYLVMRYLLRARPALCLAVSTLALLGGLALAAITMARALNGMG